MQIVLRDYQKRAVAEVSAALRNGHKRVLIVAPTGAGKTTIAAALCDLAVRQGRRFWFVAHRRELIKQALVRLVRAGIPPEQVGAILGGVKASDGGGMFAAEDLDDEAIWQAHGKRKPRALVQVCSVDSLRSRLSIEVPAIDRADARSREHPDIIVIDETHRALAASYTKLIAAYPLAIVLGLTATPYRTDGRGLGELYTELIPVAQPADLIATGALVEPRVFTVPAEDLPNLGRVKIKGGDYDPKALAAACNQGGLVGNLVEHWQRRAEDRQTVIFAADVEHSQAIAARFCEAGIVAEHLDGTTPTAQRDAILARLGRGETRVVVNVGVLCEGWDQPSVKCCVLARPTKSKGLYLQMAGRILRPWQGVGALILDHAGCVLEHGLPQADQVYTLDERPKRSSEKHGPRSPGSRVCPACYAVIESTADACPFCGHSFEDERRLEEAEGELVEVRAATRDEKREAYAQLLQEAERMGRKPGWAFYRFKDLFNGEEPPRDMRPKAPVQTDATIEVKRAAFIDLVSVQVARGYKPGWVSIRFQERFGCRPDPLWWTQAETDSSEENN